MYMNVCCKCKLKERYSTSSYCKDCHNEYQKEYSKKTNYKNIKDYFKKNNYKYQKEYQKRTRWAVKYNRRKNGWTEELFNATLKKQNYRCAICNIDSPSPSGKRDWHADHDHLTGKPRGILCSSCNTLLGRIENKEKDWFKKASNYLGWN